MGSCYSVTAKLRLVNRRAASTAVRRYIRENDGKGINFSLKEHKSEGVHTRSFDDLMRIFLAGWTSYPVRIDHEGDVDWYNNAFNASYGWESVMTDMFEVLTPHLKSGSSLKIYCDDGFDHLVVCNGKLMRLH